MTPKNRALTSKSREGGRKVMPADSASQLGTILRRLPPKATLALPGDVTTPPGTRKLGQGKKR